MYTQLIYQEIENYLCLKQRNFKSQEKQKFSIEIDKKRQTSNLIIFLLRNSVSFGRPSIDWNQIKYDQKKTSSITVRNFSKFINGLTTFH